MPLNVPAGQATQALPLGKNPALHKQDEEPAIEPALGPQTKHVLMAVAPRVVEYVFAEHCVQEVFPVEVL